MRNSPLASDTLFYVGQIPIDASVVTTSAITAVITLVCILGLAGVRRTSGRLATLIEIVVETIAQQVEEIIQRDPWPYVPLIGTLFCFLVVANLAVVVPGVEPPTAHLETPAALALIVFFSVHYFGIRTQGLAAYLRRYIRPSPIMLPLNILAELTRTFSLMVRLFGNIMSHEFMIAILVYLVGLLVPLPFMLLGILIGLIQAYIFTVLATVFIGAGVSESTQQRN